MGSLSSVQRWREFRQLSDIKGVCGHSGSAYKVSKGLHESRVLAVAQVATSVSSQRHFSVDIRSLYP